ncbi:potassium channel family protein [Peribacillus asahii]|uniref:potassium channel family protein n=1 Tax=Peribacillus asahii TaxID=228899 RepID=UPI00207AB1FB|nr:TrkA family potassium uptake protein [Peribacillus asahii]USK71841.1 TrkA family potassium uptake protein [Peribacillus asahii]
MKKQFVVFGLGRFGGSLVKEFHSIGVEVMAIDKDESKIDEYAAFATYAVVANGIDEMSLKSLGVRNFDVAFVSLGDDIEASILTCLLLKEMGVPQVWAKAQNMYHHKVLEKVGVDRVIHPERDMAQRIAHHIASEKIIDYIQLSEEYSIVEIVASHKIDKKSLMDLDIRAKYRCNIIGIQRGKDINVAPLAEEEIRQGDTLIVIGHNKDIAKLEAQGV